MITISPISGAAYYLQPGSGCCARTTPADYELDGVTKGEPAGRWAWRGENALGQTGRIVAEGPSGDAFRLVVDEARDPSRPKGADGRHPHLGRAPMQFRTVDELVAAYQRKHPTATVEEVAAYRMRAEADPRSAKTAHDVTHSAPKSWSVLQAALAWAGRDEEAETLWECLEAGADAAMTYLHEHLAFIQNRPTGPDIGGQRRARYEHAANLQYATFRHSTSRDGDPQMHIHAVLFNRALDERGRWRALYSPAFYKAKHELDAILMRVAESEATRRLGLQFEVTADGVSREIVGVSPQHRAVFSSRTRALTEEAQQLVDAFVVEKGRRPTQREKWRMLEHANKATRKPKPAVPPSREEQLAGWEEASRAETRASFAEVLEAVDDTRWVEPAGGAVEFDPEEVIERALADLEQSYSVWNYSRLTNAINRRLPDMLDVDAAELAETLEGLAQRAIRSSRLRPVDQAPVVPTPRSLLDPKRDQSVFDAPDGRRFTTDRTLQLEGSLVGRLDARTPVWLDTTRAAELVGGSGLSEEQDATAMGLLTSARWLAVVDAAAGSGKTTTMRAVSAACEQQWDVGVVGFTVAERPAQVLAGQVAAAHNIAQFRVFCEREAAGEVSDVERARFGITPGQYCVVDEASTVDTPELVWLVDKLHELGAGKVILVGDREQADPVDAGGAFGMLVDELEARRVAAARERAQPKALPPGQSALQQAAMGAWTGTVEQPAPVHRLRQVRRFDQQWERDASAAVREGRVEALHQYDTRGRVHGDTDPEKVRDAAVEGFVTDWLAGRNSIIVTGTTEQASQASDHVRQRLVEAGHVERAGVDLRDNTRAGVGDLIQTRENDRAVGAFNRQRWQVVGREQDGSLQVREYLEDAGWGEPLTLPARYVATQVELAYAATVHAVEGDTIRGTSHTLVSRTMSRSHAYVGGTRATAANHFYVELEGDLSPRRPGEPEEAYQQRVAGSETPVGRLAAVISRDDHEPAARTAIALEKDRTTNLGHLGPEWEWLVRETRASAHRRMLVDALGPTDAAVVLADPAVSRLYGLMRGAELSGHDPAVVLEGCAARGSVATARFPAAALYARLSDEMAVGERERPVPIGFEARTPKPSTGDVENERLEHAAALGRVMDRRAAELGERAALDGASWAVRTAGPVPRDADARAGWVGRVSLAAAYRERYGITDELSALGRRPAHAEPERGWLWDTAARLIGVPDHVRDLAALPDVELANREQQWTRAEQWMPANVDEQLREAHTAVVEADRQVTSARVAGRDTVDLEAQYAEMAEWVDKLEEIAAVRAEAYERTAEVRGRAQEARQERERREEVERARLGLLHRDDPGAEEPEWDPEFDEPEPEEHGQDEPLPVVEAEEPGDPWMVVVSRWFANHDPQRPVVFGSAEWVALDADDPVKRAAVTAAAMRARQLVESGEAASLDGRMAVRDMEEPTVPVDVEAVEGTHWWSTDHLMVDGPEFGTVEWAALPDGDPGKYASEAVEALRWWAGGDTLDARRERVEAAEEAARQADIERWRAEGHPVDEVVTDAELAVDAEPEWVAPEPVEDEQPVDRSRYAWVREANAAVPDEGYGVDKATPADVVEPEAVPEPRVTVVEREPEPVEDEPEPDPEEQARVEREQRRADLDAELERARHAAAVLADMRAAEAQREQEARDDEDRRSREALAEREAEVQQVELDA